MKALHLVALSGASLFLAGSIAVGQPGKPTPAPQPPAKPVGKPAAAASDLALELPAIETWTLDNGLKVAFLRVDTAPVAAVQLWYHVGSKDEPRNRRGSAHMFEHIMFKGTEHVPPEEHARNINRVGGYANARTTEDATYYINLVPSQYLDFAVELEAERMRNLLFREDMIKSEREVVKVEIKQQENSPIAKGFNRFLETAFTKHPYAWNSGGASADLDATTPADLKKFYDTYYVPNNAMLVVVGKATTDEVKAIAEKHFGKIAKGADVPRPADQATEPAQTEHRREQVEPGQIGIVIDGYKIPAASHPDIYSLQVLSLILGAGESSRLNVRLVRDDKISVQTGAQAMIREHPGLFLIFGAYLEADGTKVIEKTLLDEVAAITNKAPSADEVRKAKNLIQAAFVFGLEGVDGLAEQIGQSWIMTGDPGQFVRDLAELEKVSAADVQRVARTYLTKEALTTVVIPPGGGSQGGAP
jgi:zinc protease